MPEHKLLGEADSIWAETTPKTNYPSLETTIETDVVVVGGGLAGVTTGYLLALQGKKIVLIDAFRIGMGTSGYTTAKITSLHGFIYDFLINNFGEEKAKVYANSQEWAISEIASIVKRERIDCDFAWDNAYSFTNEKNQFKSIEKEVAAAKKLGLPASYEEDINNLPFPIASAIKFSNQAMFNPRKFLLGLLPVIDKKKGAIFENTRALDIQENTSLEVITEKGRIRAKDVVIATNYPFYDKGLLFLRMNQMRSYVYAIQTKDALPKGMYLGVGKTEPSVRPYKEKRNSWLIIGGEDHVAGDNSDGGEHFFRLQQEIGRLFSVKSFDYRWAAQDSSPVDRVAYIGKMSKSEHVYVATGFDEWGMTKSVVSAKILSDLIIRNSNEWADFYDPSRIAIKASAKKAVSLGKHVVKGFAKRIPKPSEDISKLKKGEGKILDHNGKKLAVFRDKDGKLCVVSAVCTHLGCIVALNKEEKTWDCPCHGSRFKIDGKVINGPAVKDLPEESVS